MDHLLSISNFVCISPPVPVGTEDDKSETNSSFQKVATTNYLKDLAGSSKVGEPVFQTALTHSTKQHS